MNEVSLIVHSPQSEHLAPLSTQNVVCLLNMMEHGRYALDTAPSAQSDCAELQGLLRSQRDRVVQLAMAVIPSSVHSVTELSSLQIKLILRLYADHHRHHGDWTLSELSRWRQTTSRCLSRRR